MLVAIRKNGEEVSLLHAAKSREDLKQLREEETFYCPVCKGKVQLKLGTIKQWHFAHESIKTCIGSSEPESPLHLNGKRQLYAWLVKQHLQVALEPYISSIQQRPDILFKSEQQLYALEFQCSSLSVERLQQRTQGYISKNIFPLWIVGKPQLKGNQLLQNLKAYEWNMLQMYANSSQLFLIRYFPAKQAFLFLENILPLSTKKVLVTPRTSSLQSTQFQDLFLRSPTKEAQISSEHWLTARKYWRYANSPYPSHSERHFFNICYEHKLYPSLFPIAAGWPTAYYQWIETPVYIWQTWVLMKIIKFDKQTFSFRTIYESLKQKMKRQIFTDRPFPHLQGHFSFALMRYLHFLVHCRMLKKIGKEHFRLIHPIIIPENIEMAHALDQSFFNKLLEQSRYFREIFT